MKPNKLIELKEKEIEEHRIKEKPELLTLSGQFAEAELNALKQMNELWLKRIDRYVPTNWLNPMFKDILHERTERTPTYKDIELLFLRIKGELLNAEGTK